MIKSRAKAQAAKLMKHQDKSVAFNRARPRVLDFSDAGTGKTAVGAATFAERRRKGGKRMLVIAPRSLLRTAWEADFKKFAPDMKVSVANAANCEAAFAVDADVYITNHDAAVWLKSKKAEFWSQWDTIDIDESTAFKHHTSRRSKALLALVKMTRLNKPIWKFRRAATATPNSNTILDVWHQVLLIDDGERLGPSFYAFRNHVCEPRAVPGKPKVKDWSDREGAEEAVFSLLSDITIRHRRKDCTDIPDTQYNVFEFELTKKLRETYDTMREAQLLILADGPKSDQVKRKLLNEKPKVKVTAFNAGAAAQKLIQITSGAVYDQDGKFHVIDSRRYELIMDMAEERRQPLIFYFWRHQLDLLMQEAKARKLNYGVLSGDTPDAERKRLVDRYQAGLLDGMFAHPQAAAHGLTLTRGTSTIWPCPTPNLEWFIQGSARQGRIGQKEKTEVITIIAPGTIEERVYYELLQPKDQRQRTLLDLFADESMARK